MTLAWYFAKEDKKLRYGDGRKIVVGKSHLHRGDPVLCESGLHASVNILDALYFAPGPILYRVKLGGRMAACSDKVASTKRTYLSEIDATTLLNDFARKCALDVAHLWDAPDVVRVYLESGREDLRDAASAAAKATARDAARDAAGANAWTAAWAASSAGAGAAAWAASRASAGAAAWAASMASAGARDAQNNRLTEMALSAMGLENSK